MLSLLAAVLIIGVFVGYARGGRLKNLSQLELASVWAVALGFGLRIAANIGIGLSSDLLAGMNALSFIFVLYFAGRNLRLPWMSVAALGALMNAAVILANRGRMPVSLVAANRVGELEAIKAAVDAGLPYHLGTSGVPLAFLADIIPLPFGTTKIVSIGDIVLFVGFALMLQSVMNTTSVPAPPRSEDEGERNGEASPSSGDGTDRSTDS